MDPLSVSAGIIGILTAAKDVTETLYSFSKSVKEAPKHLQDVLNEVSNISICLTQLQTFLNGPSNMSRSRSTLIMVDQVLVVLTQCIATFSELEEIVDFSRGNSTNLR